LAIRRASEKLKGKEFLLSFAPEGKGARRKKAKVIPKVLKWGDLLRMKSNLYYQSPKFATKQFL